ncbi:extracellular catalytic domain type 1 short-chain-length polyhydroxyalkanoate depolymerase [Nocardia inohanensis]|uniref:extracellular catalytic domain type 1 short-chain-length polyhydroxyalkanoate depolymerase n=1 Tax=Nocardia inohanensis TaxID=209246 RepID=UPI0009FD0594|nr:PHB depolymerase family esterase [Nocardia inohanensis]
MPLLDNTARRVLFGVLTGMLLAAGTAAAGPAEPDRLDTGDFTSAGLTYSYETFVPATLPDSPALLVMIHGCNTTAAQQRQANRLDPLARQAGFIVLYVDGSPLNQLQRQCWSGLLAPGGESRTSGDAAAIAGMTRLAAARYHVDPRRIYALGMSSGAFETALLGGYFPDLYAAIGLHSGAAFGHGALGCLGPPLPTASTEYLAEQAFSAAARYRRVVPVIAFHGDADTVVPGECGQQAVEQWRVTNNMTLAAQGIPDRIPAEPTATAHGVTAVPDGYPFTVRTWDSPTAECPVSQSWTVHGAGHTWFGGSPDPASAPFTDPRGPDSSAAAWAFFSRIERTPDGYECRPPA